ncbi:hypothetical protein BDV39DRAFT_162888 [Aspergillus sergii]|uniref:Uncharacterized protein n=1 Tax=Aspergillus sergii TaxID=1034303 RepID=A0A5N6WNX3_9EURO|nr:hypothetical protein BDV39DRAFT_162888 [Aspergillus sergii]
MYIYKTALTPILCSILIFFSFHSYLPSFSIFPQVINHKIPAEVVFVFLFSVLFLP